MKSLGLIIIALAGGSACAQVYSVTVSVQGTGYIAAPTVTSSGGGCSAQPTFSATVSNGGLNTVAPTFAGTGCTSAPTLTVSGSGSGAAAAAVLLPATIVILSTVPSQSGTGVQPSAAGNYVAWQFACWLTVPAARVAFYARPLYVMPGTSQSTQFVGAPAGLSTALASGILTEYVDTAILITGEPTATVEAGMVGDCALQQASLNAWNPWAMYGTFALNGSWTAVIVP